MVQETKAILVIDHHPKFPLPTESYTALCICIYKQFYLSICKPKIKWKTTYSYVAYEHLGLDFPVQPTVYMYICIHDTRYKTTISMRVIKYTVIPTFYLLVRKTSKKINLILPFKREQLFRFNWPICLLFICKGKRK